MGQLSPLVPGSVLGPEGSGPGAWESLQKEGCGQIKLCVPLTLGPSPTLPYPPNNTKKQIQLQTLRVQEVKMQSQPLPMPLWPALFLLTCLPPPNLWVRRGSVAVSSGPLQEGCPGSTLKKLWLLGELMYCRWTGVRGIQGTAGAQRRPPAWPLQAGRLPANCHCGSA